MNDFTKEELKFIWQRLAIADYSNFKEVLELPNKVCAMIDNYCEHESEPTEHEICCIKCQRTLI